MNEGYEEFVFREGFWRGYKKGKEDALKSIKTKTIKYFDDDEKVWKIGEVIVDDDGEDIQSTDE